MVGWLCRLSIKYFFMNRYTVLPTSNIVFIFINFCYGLNFYNYINMPTFINLGKIPSSPLERQELLAKKVEREDYYSLLGITYIQKMIIDFLISKKGYTKNDLDINREFTVELSDASFIAKADIAVKIEDKIFIIIKCVMNSLESWERYSLSFCRVVEPYQIPYAVITDGESTRMLNVLTGEILSDGLDLIPSREDVKDMIKQNIFTPYNKEKCEKEKRILYAFDAIKCSVNLKKSD